MAADNAIIEPSPALKITEAKAKTEQPDEDSTVTPINDDDSGAVNLDSETEKHANIVNAFSVYHDLDEQSQLAKKDIT